MDVVATIWGRLVHKTCTVTIELGMLDNHWLIRAERDNNSKSICSKIDVVEDIVLLFHNTSVISFL